MTPDEGRVMLLPHPGKERLPDGNLLCNWPPEGSRHRRKFMHVAGSWRDIHTNRGSGLLEIWTEYEAPTRAEPLNGPPGTAKHLHRIVTTVGAPTLNTDPWIFHPGFVWTTCRHSRADDIRTGDLILFGSSVDGQWVLDTIFAVDRRLEHPSDIQFAQEYNALVLLPLQRHQEPVRPFIGKPFHRITSPFSFVPCTLSDNGNEPFKRLDITQLLKTLQKISDNCIPSRRNAQALVCCNPRKGLTKFWNDLLSEVESQGLLLGTSFKHPGVEITGPSNIPQCCSSHTFNKC